MEGPDKDLEESLGKLNPLASDFSPITSSEEVKNSLKADAREYNPEVIIESYETHQVSHIKTLEKFEGRYGNFNFVLGENLMSYDCIEDTWISYNV